MQINNIYCGDCMELMNQLEDNSIDAIITDVPYKQEFHSRGMAHNRKNYKDIGDYGSNLSLVYDEFLNLCFRKLNKINFFTFCNKETKYDMITYAKEHGYCYQELCFCKTSPTPFTNNQWLCDVEYGLHIFYGLEVLGDYSTKRSFSVLPNLREKGIDHPTPKNVKEVERIIKNITKQGDLVLDPFSGSGTTALACQNLERDFIAFEKNEKYWYDSVKRLNDATKQLKLL